MARHRSFTIATDLQVYFCDPRSPWQRGSNENTNGLLRQYFPRATNFSPVSQAQLDDVALRLNQRPRKTLDCATLPGNGQGGHFAAAHQHVLLSHIVTGHFRPPRAATV